MDEQTQTSPEIPVAAVPEETKAPETPTPEPIPEVPPPVWHNRKYIKRSFGFMFYGTNIQGNYYEIDSKIDIDGLFGNTEFNSLEELINISKLTEPQKEELVKFINKILHT